MPTPLHRNHVQWLRAPDFARAIVHCLLTWVLLMWWPAANAGEQAASAGQTLYEARCAVCHTDPKDTKAPTLEAMRLMRAQRVGAALTQGVMRTQAEGLSRRELRDLVVYVAASGQEARTAPGPAAFCSDRTTNLTSLLVPGWGLDANSTRSVPAHVTRINARNIASLQLHWAFGLPGTESARSQPVVAGNALFIASTSGDLFALDRTRGCILWHRAGSESLRTSLALSQHGEQWTLYVGDTSGHMNAIDAENGTTRWRTHVALFDASMLTGAPVPAGDALIVPISAFEVTMARNPEYECCRAHGAITLLDAATGAVRWTTHLTADATRQGKSSVGTQLWGPSGAPVWSTPTADVKRGVVYVATGENFSAPASEYSDAVLALELTTGKVRWHYQALAGDMWNGACGWGRTGPNCPEKAGPDFDFGAAVIVTQTPDGKAILLAGQKSGDVYAFDPDDNGKLIWKRRLGAGSALGGVHWGMTAQHDTLFVPIADPSFPGLARDAEPGLYAVNIGDGSVKWSALAPNKCPLDARACRFFYRLSAAPTALPGLALAPGLDGQLRAFAAADGSLLWQADTLGKHDTVNNVDAQGGSIDSAGAIAVDDMLYVQSGYGGFGQMPGNVLLAYRLAEPTTTAPDVAAWQAEVSLPWAETATPQVEVASP